MRHIFLIICLVLFAFEVFGQVIPENLPGQVSFVSSQSVYVKYKTTSGINIGDTLYIASKGNLTPALTVANLSSSSCVCTVISGLNLLVGDLIIARPRIKEAKQEGAEEKPDVKDAVAKDNAVETPVSETKVPEFKQKIKGSISAYSYTDFSNTAASNSQRFRYTFSLDAKNISDSRFSIDSYLSFKHKVGEWTDVKDNLFNALKIYSLAIKYDLNKTTLISLGRRINPRISSIGAMDGLQIEKTLNKFAMGAVVGSRPDYTNYGLDPKLFQYGAYLAFNTKTTNAFTETSLAFMQQTNNSKIDRRFVYFQHSNSLLKDLYFFSTFEVDLYKLNIDTINGNTAQNTFNPTGVYLSLRYKLTKNLNISGSYDARKNVMYYESFKTSIDSAFEKELRQGFRLQASYRITRDIMFGIQSGYRYLKSDPHPSKNLYSYVTYSQIPGVNMSLTVHATYLQSNYMNGKILGGNLTKDFLQGKFSSGLGYRYIDYRLPESFLTIKQNIAEMNVSWQFTKTMSLSLNYEGTFEQQNKYNRFYFQIRKRF
jgi:hypothetical protein